MIKIVSLGKVVERVGAIGLHVVRREHSRKGLRRIDDAMVAIMRRGTLRPSVCRFEVEAADTRRTVFLLRRGE